MPVAQVLIRRFKQGFKARKIAGDITAQAERGVAELDAKVGEIAHAAAKYARQGIEQQHFDHDPLDPDYARFKEVRGLDPRTLIAKNEYVRAISARRVGPMLYHVGVPKDAVHSDGTPMPLISRVHEHGSFTAGIPARPHLRPARERARYYVRRALEDFNRAQKKAAEAGRKR